MGAKLSHDNNFSWDFSSQSFVLNDQAYSSVKIYEDYPYIFTNQSSSGIKFVIGSSINSTYYGSDLFNNEISRFREYLYWFPSRNTPRGLIGYNPNSSQNTVSFELVPYDSVNIPHTSDSMSLWGYSIKGDAAGNLFVSEPDADGTAGKVHFYKFTEPGYEHIKSVGLSSSERTHFGANLSLGEDDLLVSAPDEDGYRGAVYAYSYEQNGSGLANDYYQRIFDESSEPGSLFGWSTANFGDFLGVSSLNLGKEEGGGISLFRKNQSWDFFRSYKSLIDNQDIEFGYDLDLSENFLVVGAPGFDDAISGDDSGAVLIFDYTGTDPTPILIAPDDLSSGDRFGHSVKIYENKLFVGSIYGDGIFQDTGVIYVFDFNQTNWNLEAKISPPTSDKNQLFSQKIVFNSNTLVAVSPNTESGSFGYAFKESYSKWNLVTSIALDQFLDGDPSFLSLDMVGESIFAGNPNHNQASGAVTAYYSPAWGEIPSFSVPPILSEEFPLVLHLDEDDSRGLTHDFNGTHPFNADISWDIIESNASLSSWDLNSTSGIFRYVPEGNFSGTHSFTLSANVGGLAVNRFFSVLVSPLNDPPVFSGTKFVSWREGTFQSFPFTVYDSDSPSPVIQIQAGELPSGLSFEGERVYGVPAVGSSSSSPYEITFSVSDENGIGDVSIISFQVLPYSPAPQTFFKNQSVSIVELTLPEDFNSSLWQERMAEFDIPSEGEQVLMEVHKMPENGHVILSETFNDSTDIVFFSDPNFVGTNLFTLNFFFKSLPDIVSSVDFRVETTKVNDPPAILSSLPNPSAQEAQLFYHHFNLYDPDRGDRLDFKLDGLPKWITYDGNSTIFGTPQRGDFIEQSKANILAVVQDQSGAKFSQVFSIEIIPNNYPPEIIYEGSQSIKLDEDTPNFFSSTLRVEDVDTSNSRLEWRIDRLADHGTLDYEFTDNNLTFRYKPGSDYFGLDEVTILSVDREDPLSFDSVVFNFEVSNIQDPPQFDSIPYTGLLKGTPWQYEIMVSDPDQDQSLIVEPLVDLPAWLSLRKKTSTRWVLSGIVPDIQDSSLFVKLRVTDSQGLFDEQFFDLSFLNLSDIGQIEINENEIGEQVINEDNNWTGESLSVNAFPGRKVTWSIIEEPEFGQFFYKEKQNGKIDDITYVPTANFHGLDSLVIQASDGFSSDLYSLRFRVLSIDDSPEFIEFVNNLSIEDRDHLDVTIYFSDGDGLENLSYFSASVPSWIDEDLSDLASGKIRLRGLPGVENIGDYTMNFSLLGLDDGLSTEEQLNLSVKLLNHPPVVFPHEINISMMEDNPSTWSSPKLSASDFETTNPNNLLWQIHKFPQNGSASIDPYGNNLQYLPDSNFSGVDTFSIKVTDPGGIDYSPPRFTEIPVKVSVSNVNDLPVILTKPPSDKLGSVSWTDEFKYEYNFIAYDSDLNWQGPPVVTLETPLPRWAKWQDEGNGSVKIHGQPSFLDIGVYPFSIKVSCGEDEIVQTFDLEIRVDDYPPAVKDNIRNEFVQNIKVFLYEDSVDQNNFFNNFNFTATNPDYEENDRAELIWGIEQEPTSGGVLVVNGTGPSLDSLYYDPPNNFFGVDEFAINVSEGDRKTIIPVYVYIRSVPDPPFFTKPLELNLEATLGELFSVELEAFDPEDDHISFKLFTDKELDNDWLGIISQDAVNGFVTIGGIPPTHSDINSSFSLTVVATDSTGRFTTTQAQLSYLKINRPPQILIGNELVVFFDDNFSTKSSLFFPILASDADGDSLNWEVSLYNQPNFGEVLLIETNNSIEELRYIPKEQAPSRDEFSLIVSDGNSSSEILINAFFDRTDFFINFPDEVPDAFENKSFQIQFFVQNNHDELGEFNAQLKEAPSWLTINPLDNKHFVVQGLPEINSAGEYHVVIEVSHPNGLSVQTLKFDLKVNSRSKASLRLLGDKTLPVSKGLNLNDFIEPGYYAQNAFGEEITQNVKVSFPDEVNKGINFLTYSTDDYSSSRILLGHDQSPFVGFKETHTNLMPKFTSEHRKTSSLFLLDFVINENSIESRADQYIIHRANLGDTTFDPRQIVSFDRISSQIYDFETGESLLWVTGIQKIASEEIAMDDSQLCFVDCFGLDGSEIWQLTMGLVGQFDSITLIPSNSDQILLCGRLFGEIKIGSESFVSEQSQWIGIIITSKGEIKKLFSINLENLVPDASFYLGGSWKLMSSSEEFSGEVLSELHSINKSGEIFVESNFTNVQIRHAEPFGENIYTFGRNQKILESDFPSYFLGQIFLTGEFNWKTNILAKSHDSEILKIHAFYDEFNRIQCIIEYKGSFSYQNHHFESVGGLDLLLLCISRVDGTFLWSENLGGDANDSLKLAFSNEAGLTGFGVETEVGAVFLNQKIDPVAMGKINVLNLESSNTLPILSNQDEFEFQVDSLASHEIEITNADYYKLFVVDGPDWLKLVDNNGNYFITGSPNIKDYFRLKDKTEIMEVRFVGYNNEYASLELPISITLPPEWQISRKVMPELNNLLMMEGNVKSISTKPVPGGYLVYGNYNGNVQLDAHVFSTFSRSAGFVYYLASDFGFAEGFNFSSSGSTSVTDLHFQSSKEVFVVGNFRGTLKVGNASLRSSGGTDVFIAVINLLSNSAKLYSLGGAGDEFVSSLSLSDNSILLSGYYYDDTNLGGVDIHSQGGGKDAYIAKLPKSDLTNADWVFSFGGNGDDSFKKVQYCDDHIVAIANFSDFVNLGAYEIVPSGINNALIAIFHESGKLLKYSVLDSTGHLTADFLSYSKIDQNYIVAGTFAGELFTRNEKLKSDSSDIFISIYGSDLSLQKANKFGGNKDQKITAFEDLDNGLFYIGGDFTGSVNLTSEEVITIDDQDAFVSIVDKQNLRIQDSEFYQSVGNDWISGISSLDGNQILISGNGNSSKFSWLLPDASNQSKFFVSSHQHQEIYPRAYVNSYGTFQTDAPFNLSFNTFGWQSNSGTFSFESSNLPPWMFLNLDTNGNGYLSGFSPKKSGTYPFDFVIRADNNESVFIRGELETKNSRDSPSVLFSSSMEVTQFDVTRIDLLVENLEPEDIEYSFDFPNWADLIIEESPHMPVIELLPLEGTTGSHTLKVLVKSKASSLFELLSIEINVVPRKENIFGFSDAGFDEWSENWLGQIFLKENGWAYHFELGWIYLLHNLEEDGIWIWESNWGWLWASESYWEGKEGHLFSNDLDGWVFFTKRYQNNLPLVFNYQTKRWINFDLVKGPY